MNNIVNAKEFVPAYDLPSIEFQHKFLDDPLYTTIIRTSSFQRLFRIPFLGALSYLDEKEINNTRGDHSIGVALLTYYFCQLSELPKITERLFVLSALLHDIHHLPFSHTMELALKNELPDLSLVYETERIISSRSRSDVPSIEDIIQQFNIKKKSLPLFKPRSKRPLVFGITHNVDTLDGITRAHSILFTPDAQLRRLPTCIMEIISKGNLDGKADMENLDAFWELKNKVYMQGIYDEMKVLFERIIGYYLFDLCKERGILGKLTNYTDNDFFQMFPKLYEKIQKLWQLIKLIYSSSNTATHVLNHEILTDFRDKITSTSNGEVLKFRITTRQFRINKTKPIVITRKSSWKQRYIVKPFSTILMLRVDKNIIKNIEDILEYPLLRKRFSNIAEQADEYLI